MIADIVRPPKKPINVVASAIPKAAKGEKGVAHQSAIPTRLALKTPPTKPSSVLFVLTFAATGILCAIATLTTMGIVAWARWHPAVGQQRVR